MPWIIAFFVMFAITGDLATSLVTVGAIWLFTRGGETDTTSAQRGEVDSDGYFGE